MATTERFARLADASRRRHPSGRARFGGACLLLICALPGLPGCAGLNNPLVSNNPYEKDESTGWSWFSGASEDQKPLLLPGAEDAKRTAMDEKARTDLEAAKLLYQQKEYAKAELMLQIITKAKKLRLDTLEDAQFYMAESPAAAGRLAAPLATTSASTSSRSRTASTPRMANERDVRHRATTG